MALMAQQHERAGEDLLRGLCRGGPRTSWPMRAWLRSIFGTEHHELELSFATTRRARRARLASRRAARRSLSTGLPRPLRARGQHVTVALSGQGADEFRRLPKAPGRITRRGNGSAFPVQSEREASSLAHTRQAYPACRQHAHRTRSGRAAPRHERSRRRRAPCEGSTRALSRPSTGRRLGEPCSSHSTD